MRSVRALIAAHSCASDQRGYTALHVSAEVSHFSWCYRGLMLLCCAVWSVARGKIPRRRGRFNQGDHRGALLLVVADMLLIVFVCRTVKHRCTLRWLLSGWTWSPFCSTRPARIRMLRSAHF